MGLHPDEAAGGFLRASCWLGGEPREEFTYTNSRVTQEAMDEGMHL